MWTVVVLVVLALELLAGAVLWRQAVTLRERVAALDDQVGELEATAEGRAPALRAPVGNPMLSVEILNAHELASRESWVARRFGTLVPRIVGREVAARAAAQLVAGLTEQGVRAEVRIVEPRAR
ncbi:hypothetical protein [Pseudonocardia sp. GCM10023141]|uniref:hypothetical protein n=1 Tax=Pseudonocardia sp. GCM10023141 TaxID=3252653 RepID=UPI00360CF39D